jgi:hypothetical protein
VFLPVPLELPCLWPFEQFFLELLLRQPKYEVLKVPLLSILWPAEFVSSFDVERVE